MASLDRGLRRELENAVKKARRVAEAGARQAIERLAVHEREPYPVLSADEKKLRNHLRAHARQLGDKRDEQAKTQGIGRLVSECAYEHWHRLLFARFLAENDLLIEPASGQAMSLDECRELAREQNADWLPLASRFAQRMLPQIFRDGDPVLEVSLPPETRQELEGILESLPREVFTADDSLGWVYQFWQAEQKEAVNKAGNKIGAEELPAVTQLFTEDYMVLFLLHNTLGAWWAGKHLAAHPELARTAASEDDLRRACALDGYDWTYLRFVRDDAGTWRPAAGTYSGWPAEAKKLRVLDPCMGSGHFLVFALPILVRFRMAEDGLALADAVDAVLRDNLYGLEIDPRCTQIAAFNLALAAWKLTGHRALPALHLACSGLAPGMSKKEWLELARRAAPSITGGPARNLFGGDDNLFSQAALAGLEALYDLFSQAPTLGSLIDPHRSGNSLFQSGFERLKPIVDAMLGSAGNDEMQEAAVTARGMAKAAEILAGKFTLVVTNVPYLARVKQGEVLKEYCESSHPNAAADLATCLVERCLSFCVDGGSSTLVTPHNWLFLGSYRELRQRFLELAEWDWLIRLGAGAFDTIGGEVVNVALVALTQRTPSVGTCFGGLDISPAADPAMKAKVLLTSQWTTVSQRLQSANPDSRIVLGDQASMPLLSVVADSFQGVCTGDFPRFGRLFWEPTTLGAVWKAQQTTVSETTHVGGLSHVFLWQQGAGVFRAFLDERLGVGAHGAWVRGLEAWGLPGVCISQTGSLNASRYVGQAFDNNAAVIIPKDASNLAAIWAYCSSPAYASEVRRIDQALKVTNITLLKVPFDLAHWQRVAAEKYPNGLPKPHSDDPTQWLFNGHPRGSDAPLQVAVARLVGYRWPRQTGSEFMDCPALGPDGLEAHADEDGIVCLSAMHQEDPADVRLRKLLADAYGAEWSAAKQNELLAAAGFAGRTLDEWLRDGFFEQHSAMFHNRPFVWHVWDGRTDGFHALVNYHRLAGPDGGGRRTLEKLAHTYLGDWITRQRADQAAGVEGADGRLAAAAHLKAELEKILEGEPPYDLFVRWKPLEKQAIGWEPDLDDGVRLNLRPFMKARPLGARKRDACILRATPKSVKWDKDRGKEPNRAKSDYPWFWGWDESAAPDFEGRGTFDGNRWNDLHYTNDFKRKARAARGGGMT